KTETTTERGDQPLQFRPLNTNQREGDQAANQRQQIFGDGGDCVAGTRRQIQVLQNRQFQQRGQIAQQLRGDDKHQNGNQHRTEGNRLQTFYALYRGGDIPQRNIFEEAESGMDF